MPPKHTLVIILTPDGKITGEVQGIKGPSCTEISKWLDELGEVTEDRHSPDYYKPNEQEIVNRR